MYNLLYTVVGEEQHVPRHPVSPVPHQAQEERHAGVGHNCFIPSVNLVGCRILELMYRQNP